MGYYKDLSYDKMTARRDGGSFTTTRQPAQPTQPKLSSMAIAAGSNGPYHLWTVEDLKRAIERGFVITTHDGQPVTGDTVLTVPGWNKSVRAAELLSGR